MTNYAFLDIAQEFHLEIISKFLERTGTSISFMNTAVAGNFHGDINKCQNWVDELKQKNKDGEFTTINDFIFPKSYTRFVNIPWVITEREIIDFKHIESMAMRLMDRAALIPTSAFSRRRIYLLLLNYFSYILEKHNIEGVVVFDTPHGFFSHIMYELCKAKGIKLLKLEYHFLTNYSVLLNQDEWPAIPEDFKNNKDEKELLDLLPEDLKSAVFEGSEILKNYKSKETKAIVKQSFFSTSTLYLRYLDKAIKNLIMGFFPYLFKKEVLHFSSLNGINNRLRYRIILNKQLWKLIKLNIHYNNIANKDISLCSNYVFVGLHMQPEKTSQPMGGEFDNQLMMVKVLSDSVPEGWKVYVKEHPNQFNVRKVPNRHYRDKLFYDCLEELKNVEIVPLEINSENLIQNSQMVATLTGTLGWEAMTKSIPALVFGDTYYMACRAARKISNVDSCKNAIAELRKMDAKDIKIEILRYIAFYHEQKWLIQTANWQTNFEINSITYEEQIDNIVNRLNYFHSKNLEY